LISDVIGAHPATKDKVSWPTWYDEGQRILLNPCFSDTVTILEQCYQLDLNFPSGTPRN